MFLYFFFRLELEADIVRHKPPRTKMLHITKTGQTTTDAILGPFPEAFFFTSLMGTKLMLRDSRWSKRTQPENLARLQRRISFWFEKSVKPTFNVIAKNHKIPKFARKVVEAFKGYDKKDRSAVDLHVALLTSASEHIFDACQGDLGSQTVEKARTWFNLMQSTSNCRIVKRASSTVKSEFGRILQKHQEDNLHGQSWNAESCTEYPFFDPESLFILVAYMVYLYTKSSEPSRFSSKTKYAVEIEKKRMLDWENLSGEMFEHFFSVMSHGLHKTDTEEVANVQDVCFSLINLPYKDLHQYLQKHDVPSVSGLHSRVMGEFTSIFSTIAASSQFGDDYYVQKQMALWTQVCANATSHAKMVKKTLQNREKVFMHSIRHRKCKKAYKPRSTYTFERDIFIMGHHSSLHWTHCTLQGRSARKYIVI